MPTNKKQRGTIRNRLIREMKSKGDPTGKKEGGGKDGKKVPKIPEIMEGNKKGVNRRLGGGGVREKGRNPQGEWPCGKEKKGIKKGTEGEQKGKIVANLPARRRGRSFSQKRFVGLKKKREVGKWGLTKEVER